MTDPGSKTQPGSVHSSPNGMAREREGTNVLTPIERGRSSLGLALTALTALVAALLASLAFAGAALGADLCAEAGSGAGQCLNPEGVATDLESELVYVTEVGNDRVSVFEPDGTFVLAFGWGVDTGAEELQTCTTASGCQAGIPGSGAGQFDNPRSVAVDNSAGATKGEVYVGTDSFRVQRFEADGTFVSAFGTEGKGECEIARESDRIAVGPGGDVFVADAAMIGTKESEGFNNRVEKFSPSGECLDETALFGPARNGRSAGCRASRSTPPKTPTSRSKAAAGRFASSTSAPMKPSCANRGSTPARRRSKRMAWRSAPATSSTPPSASGGPSRARTIR